jgi:TonB family protein
MASVFTQSIFQSSASDKSWRGYAGSIVAHGVLLLLALTITIPVIRPARKTANRIVLLAPTLSPYKAKIKAPVPVIRPKPRPIPTKLLVAVAPKPDVLAASPAIKPTPPTPPTEVKPELPVSPKPTIQTGAFQQAVEVAKNTQPKPLAVGGFGDPYGATPAPNAKPEIAPTKVGAFDAPNGASGHSQIGEVKQGVFGSAGRADSNTHTGSNAVKTSGFDNSTIAQVRKKTTDQSGTQTFTPVEVLSKPRPAYTAEARNLRLEGHVSLEVVFLSTGSVRVVRVLHGLGHGLDEAAEQAAMRVRFKPAMRGGMPVDTNATIDITFELT